MEQLFCRLGEENIPGHSSVVILVLRRVLQLLFSMQHLLGSAGSENRPHESVSATTTATDSKALFGRASRLLGHLASCQCLVKHFTIIIAVLVETMAEYPETKHLRYLSQ